MEDLRKDLLIEKYDIEDSRVNYNYIIQKDEASEQAFVLYKVQNIIVLVAVILLITMDIMKIQFTVFNADNVILKIYSPFSVQELINELRQLFGNIFVQG